VLDELDRGGLQEVQATGLHWTRGFFLAKDIARADQGGPDLLSQDPSLRGNFTLSLKIW